MRRSTRELTIPGARHLGILVLGMLAVLPLLPCQAAWAQCASVLIDGDFENQRSGAFRAPWIPEGRAGMDLHKGFSHGGDNNAWASNNKGWNAIRQPVQLQAGLTYTLSGFVHTSPNVKDGYFGFRDAGQRPVSEKKYGPLAGYRELSVRFRPTRSGTYFIFTGFWAPNQDAWIRIDDLRLDAPCPDVVLNPADD